MAQKEEMLRIRCTMQTKKKFLRLKIELGFKNSEELLLYLINLHESKEKLKPQIV